MNIDAASVHRLKNQLAIIQGFCELLLIDLTENDKRRSDVLRIQEACHNALKEVPTYQSDNAPEPGEPPAEANREK